MKYLKHLSLLLTTLFYSVSAFAIDPTGVRFDRDSDHYSFMPFFLFISGIIVGAFIIISLISSRNNKSKSNNPPPESYKPYSQQDYIQQQLDYLESQDKENKKAFKGCVFGIVIAIIFLILFFLNNPHLFK